MQWLPDFEYYGRIVHIVDGDTVDVEVDLGFSITTKQRCRLFGINAPETRGDERHLGLRATDHLELLLAETADEKSRHCIRTRKDRKGKYGRYLVEIVGMNEAGDFVNVNDQMVRDGHASEVEY